MKKIALGVILLAVAMMPVCLRAQDTTQGTPTSSEQTAPQHFYRLNLVVKELDETGKVVNTRGYFMTVGTTKPGHNETQMVKTGSRIPVLAGSSGSNGGAAQFQYIDLGMNLAVRNVREMGDSLSFTLVAEISSIARQTEVAGMGEPVIRQNSWDSAVILPIGKPTVVGSSDDLDSKGKLQVEVTATRIN